MSKENQNETDGWRDVDGTHDGWTNRNSWAVHRYITNDKALLDLYLSGNDATLPERLSRANPVANALRVNWDEVAEALLEQKGSDNEN